MYSLAIFVNFVDFMAVESVPVTRATVIPASVMRTVLMMTVLRVMSTVLRVQLLSVNLDGFDSLDFVDGITDGHRRRVGFVVDFLDFVDFVDFVDGFTDGRRVYFLGSVLYDSDQREAFINHDIKTYSAPLCSGTVGRATTCAIAAAARMNATESLI
jgi:hypothetical protein